ncbi:hypothetical protein H0H93_009844 [Arthromyces matolae]|nr:hypothetical protein H0H93_009844 [Arthromyces matolae]
MSSTVYLEDIEKRDTRRVETQEDGTPSSPASSSSASLVKSTSQSTSGVKRQRTLVDMFSSSQEKSSPKETSAKKLKLAPSGSFSSSSSSLKTSSPNVFGRQKLNAIPFSMSEYYDTMTDDQRRLLTLECEVMGKSWLKLLKDEIKKPYFISLKQFLWDEGVKGPDNSPVKLRIYPAPKDIYAWSNTPLGKVKVVILGQDPYHGPGQAHELKEEFPEFEVPKHGNLTTWALNGVLMLNTCLTVRAGDAGSHSNKGWEQFTDRVVDIVDKYGGANLPSPASDVAGIGRGVVFLAWGSWAGKRVAKLDKHPSPLSADRGFRGNNHFKQANDWLEIKYGPEGKVDWCNLDVKEEL